MSYLNFYAELLDDVINSRVDYGFENQGNIVKMDKLAKDLVVKNTIEGYISSMFIFHQIIENHLDYMIDYYNYYLKHSLFPMEVDNIFKKEKYFAGKCETLRRAPSISGNKEEIIALLNQINTLRNELAHSLLSFKVLKDESIAIQGLYEQIMYLFEEEEDQLELSLAEYFKERKQNIIEDIESHLLTEIEDYSIYLNKKMDVWYRYLKKNLGSSISIETAKAIKNSLLELEDDV